MDDTKKIVSELKIFTYPGISVVHPSVFRGRQLHCCSDGMLRSFGQVARWRRISKQIQNDQSSKKRVWRASNSKKRRWGVPVNNFSRSSSHKAFLGIRNVWNYIWSHSHFQRFCYFFRKWRSILYGYDGTLSSMLRWINDFPQNAIQRCNWVCLCISWST